MLSVLPVDSGVIRCICGYDHDDNFTIQCERCNAWQHAGCVNIANEASVPENYLCPDCNENGPPISREEARERQKQILKQRAQLQKLATHRPPPPGEESHEEPKKRGRKRRSESEPMETRERAISNSHVYFVPSHDLLWSPRASAWLEANRDLIKSLPPVPRDLRPSQLHVMRTSRHAKGYNLGVDTLGLVATSNIPAHRFVCDVTGEVLLRTEYAKEPHNQFARLGCPKPGTVFVPGLPLVIDSRRRGSQALFLRRSPQPNVRLVPRRTSKGGLRVLLYTRCALSPGDELQLGWHWPAAHPIRVAPESPLLQTVYWLLGLTPEECLPSRHANDDDDDDIDDEEDEDWEIVEAQAAPARPPTRAHTLREAFKKRPRDSSDSSMDLSNASDAPTLRVWISAPQEPVVQTKKKLSLADYIKKRA